MFFFFNSSGKKITFHKTSLCTATLTVEKTRKDYVKRVTYTVFENPNSLRNYSAMIL